MTTSKDIPKNTTNPKGKVMDEKFGAVFIHGAGLGAFIWKELNPLLNYPVLNIEFPNRESGEKANKNLSFEDYLKSAVDQIEKWGKHKMVIVAHSIGGCLGLKLANITDKIVGFVGISAAIPGSGESFVSCLPIPQNVLMPFLLQMFGTRPPNKTIEKELCNGLTPNQTREIINRFTPEAKSLYTTKVHYALPDTQKLYIKLTDDKSFPIHFQGKMIKNLKAQQVAEIHSGHLPMLSKPEELSAVLNNFINQNV